MFGGDGRLLSVLSRIAEFGQSQILSPALTALSVSTQDPNTCPIPSTQQTSSASVAVVSQEYLSVDEILRIKHGSSSRMNFAANINRWIFSFTERSMCNVRGKLGKGKLDEEKVGYTKLVAFRMLPLESKETEKTA